MKKIDKIEFPSLNEQKKIVDETELRIKHDGSPFLSKDISDCDQIPDSWKSFKQGYVPPTAEEIRKTFGGFSSTELANMLGLSDGRIIRRWKSGENEIPYAAWRLFLIITERVIL